MKDYWPFAYDDEPVIPKSAAEVQIGHSPPFLVKSFNLTESYGDLKDMLRVEEELEEQANWHEKNQKFLRLYESQKINPNKPFVPRVYE